MHTLTLVRLDGTAAVTHHATPMGVTSRLSRYRRAAVPLGVAVERRSHTADPGGGSATVVAERQVLSPEEVAGGARVQLRESEVDAVERWTAPLDTPAYAAGDGVSVAPAADVRAALAVAAGRRLCAGARARDVEAANTVLAGCADPGMARTDEAEAALAAGEACAVLIQMPVGQGRSLWWLHERFPLRGQESRCAPCSAVAGLLLAGAGRLRAARRSDAGTLVWVVTSLAPLTVSELHALAPAAL